MKKRIAVFIGEVTGTLQEGILNAIVEKANGLKYDVMVFCTYGSFNDDFLYAEGEKRCITIPDLSLFDGVIVTEDVFNNPGLEDDLYDVLKKTAKCPVVYMRSVRDGFYSVLSENKEAIASMTEHFIKDHKFTDICYMSGKKESQDAKLRLRGFVSKMEEYGLPIEEHTVFHGDYWRDKGKEAIDWFMTERQTYPQVIICANDYMALSICEELKKRGISVPEDVCVSGFDCVSEAIQNDPPLTTFEVNFEEMVYCAIDIIDAANRKEHVNDCSMVLPKMHLQKSCGCCKAKLDEVKIDYIAESYRQTYNMKNAMLAVTEYQDAFEEEEYLWVTEKYGDVLQSDEVYLCMCDTKEKEFEAVEKQNQFTDQMILKRIFHGTERAEHYNIVFDRKDLLPKEFRKEDEIQNLVFFSMHFKNTIYGYLAAKIPDMHWFDVCTQTFIMNLANAIENASVQKEIADLEQIKAQYQRDVLTGLLNRRGFDKQIRDSIAFRDKNSNDLYISIDMDNLKYINDTFGHLEGDRALCLLAQAIKSCMEEEDFCARVGGDEFAAFLPHSATDRGIVFSEKFQKALAKTAENDVPYTLDASFGICSLKEGKGLTLVECMQKADMRMYERKRNKKNRIEYR